MKPRLLDLFCGAGGAAMGYHRAGFEVVGVDIRPQRHYPFEFHQADALTFPLSSFSHIDAIHASPPCQDFSVTASLHENRRGDLLTPVRMMLQHTSLPWVIENVPGAPMRPDVVLCGSMFGLGVKRHRCFETSWHAAPFPPAACACRGMEPLDVTGTGGPGGQHRKPSSLAQARAAMGIDWMSREELGEAIPPAYCEFIGAQLMRHLALAERATP